MFEKAIRMKLRFGTTIGQLSVEQLYDLPLTGERGSANLDDIAISLHKQLNNSDQVSFVDKERKSDEIIQLKFDIVKHIIEVKLEEEKLEKEKLENKRKRQHVLALIAQKQDQAMGEMSVEELQRLAEELK